MQPDIGSFLSNREQQEEVSDEQKQKRCTVGDLHHRCKCIYVWREKGPVIPRTDVRVCRASGKGVVLTPRIDKPVLDITQLLLSDSVSRMIH